MMRGGPWLTRKCRIASSLHKRTQTKVAQGTQHGLWAQRDLSSRPSLGTCLTRSKFVLMDLSLGFLICATGGLRPLAGLGVGIK